ncbi:MAG: aminotransferase class I/II-fold pyridoxal phosphate-dependent enzyme [Marinobacter sp.]
MNSTITRGGGLLAAARRWGIPPDHWLDLSCGINRRGWPVPPLPASLWYQSFGGETDLDAVLHQWGRAPGSAGSLAVPGTRMAMRILPLLRAPCRVGIPAQAPAELAEGWRLAGHTVLPVTREQSQAGDAWLNELDILVWTNPDARTGATVSRDRLLDWHGQLIGRDGWLVVDEAFVDGCEGTSLVPMSSAPGLVILRSLETFFGLAGIRAGAVFAEPAVTDALAARLGPEAIGAPERYIMARALKDLRWQQHSVRRLAQDSERLDQALQKSGLPATTGTLLYRHLALPEAPLVADFLAGQGILVRCFDAPSALRIDLPGDRFEWERLERTLQHLTNYIDHQRACC